MQQFCIKYCNSSPHVVENLLYLGDKRIRSSVTMRDDSNVHEILTCWNLAPYLTKLHHWWHMSYIPSISEVLTKSLMKTLQNHGLTPSFDSWYSWNKILGLAILLHAVHLGVYFLLVLSRILCSTGSIIYFDPTSWRNVIPCKATGKFFGNTVTDCGKLGVGTIKYGMQQDAISSQKDIQDDQCPL